MTKGVNRSVICIKDTGSKYFEEAIFIVNPSAAPQASEGEMADEAKRIVDRYIKKYCTPPKHKKKGNAGAIVLGLVALSTLAAVWLLIVRMF